jgi:4-alpha-glucanotransferase
VHDTSTLRGWWTEEPNLAAFWNTIGLDGSPPDQYTAAVARDVIAQLLRTSSALCVFQVQDLIAASGLPQSANPEEERVNVPGTVSDRNWSYRLPVSLREMIESDGLHDLSPEVAARANRNIRE